MTTRWELIAFGDVFKETKALLEQEENLLDKVDDVDSDLERKYEKEPMSSQKYSISNEKVWDLSNEKVWENNIRF